MGIEFKARVLLELGAELISSDAVAIYELVKNAIDAKSDSIEIAVDVVLQHSSYQRLKTMLDATTDTTFSHEKFKNEIEIRLEADADQELRDLFFSTYGTPKTLAASRSALDQAYFAANTIKIIDKGDGMDKDKLQSGYLTIGTPIRLMEKGNSKTPQWNITTSTAKTTPTLGEKGIGRLAAMRLGHYVEVKTTTKNSDNWYLLRLDWRRIFNDPTLDASALDYEPEPGPIKKKDEVKGTTLLIRDLQSDWTDTKLKSLVSGELIKLADPFDSDFMLDFLTLKLQGNALLLPEFENSKLEHADAVCRATFQRVPSWSPADPLDGLELAIEVDYKYYKGATRTWHLRSEHLASCMKEPAGRRKKAKAADLLPDGDAIVDALPRLGPFDMKFYWFNRGRMQREESELWTHLHPFVRSWSGGLLVYRDGFRVYPYGSPTDDWLDLDRSALSGSAYKLNRAQIIGYLKISQKGNPSLHDQTNREGFRDCPEKEALRRLLRHVFITKCKIFLEDTLKENKESAPETIETLEGRVGTSEHTALIQLRKLQTRVPDESACIEEVVFQIGEIREAWERAKTTIRNHEDELEQYVHLAGVGLQVEFIAHELARITDNALNALKNNDVLNSEATRRGLETQLKTLEKRIRVLDLMSIPGRQRKNLLYVEEIVQILQEMHEAKILRHGLNFSVRVIGKAQFKAKVEQGQILQILDNLFSNSFYWLSNRFDRNSVPEINIEVNRDERTIKFSDNGPGVPTDMAEDVFKPFVTTKPPGEGRGLGLFISRRLAEYNQVTLELTRPAIGGRHNEFLISFKNTPAK